MNEEEIEAELPKAPPVKSEGEREILINEDHDIESKKTIGD